jgi:hypothetical protein
MPFLGFRDAREAERSVIGALTELVLRTATRG